MPRYATKSVVLAQILTDKGIEVIEVHQIGNLRKFSSCSNFIKSNQTIDFDTVECAGFAIALKVRLYGERVTLHNELKGMEPERPGYCTRVAKRLAEMEIGDGEFNQI